MSTKASQIVAPAILSKLHAHGTAAGQNGRPAEEMEK
jgi:hypothetical protein